MHNYMIEKIVEALEIPETEAAAAKLKLMDKMADIDAIIWSTDDILSEAESIGKKIDGEDARYLLHRMLRKHDAGIGVTWDTIHEYLSDFPDLPEGENEAG